jgi:hypothetical protein
MKKIICAIVTACILISSCKSGKEDKNPSEELQKNMEDISSSVSVEAKEGQGKITLQCNGNTYEIKGVCGAVSAMGSLDVVVKDDTTPVKVFTVSMKTNELPASSTVYSIVKSNLDDKDLSHIVIDFTDMRTEAPMTWASDNSSGKLKFEVTGNQIKCSFTDIALQPNSFYNKEAQNKTASVSGEFYLYKN